MLNHRWLFSRGRHPCFVSWFISFFHFLTQDFGPLIFSRIVPFPLIDRYCSLTFRRAGCYALLLYRRILFWSADTWVRFQRRPVRFSRFSYGLFFGWFYFVEGFNNNVCSCPDVYASSQSLFLRHRVKYVVHPGTTHIWDAFPYPQPGVAPDGGLTTPHGNQSTTALSSITGIIFF